jgi:alpha-D-ribose 1-methylphosphonate 5-triphosphate synthase subunit PhnH
MEARLSNMVRRATRLQIFVTLKKQLVSPEKLYGCFCFEYKKVKNNNHFITETPMRTGAAQLKENRFDFVHDSQQTFRTIMMALAFPGTVRRLEPISLSVSKPDFGFILQPLLTLLDLETTFHVVCRNNKLQALVSRYLELNTNSRLRKLPQADFVLCLDRSLNGRFPELKKGTLTQPNQSATVLYLVDRLAAVSNIKAIKLNLTGPGIHNVQTLYVSGLDPAELQQRDHFKNDYPLGVDIYLVSRSGDLAGIPRSVNIEITGDR